MIYAHSLKLQLAEDQLFPFFSPEKISLSLRNKLVVLLGTNCSGKSALSREILDHHPRVIVLEPDERLRKLALEFFKNREPEAFHQLFPILGCSLLHYISCPEEDPFWTKNLPHLLPYLRYITPLRQLCERYFKELYKSAYLSILHERKFMIYAHSLKLQLAEVQLFPFFSPEKISLSLRNKLVVLLGTSCSGKSALSRKILEHHPRVIVLEPDERLRKLALEFFKNREPEAFHQLFPILGCSLLHYISCPEEDPFWTKNLPHLLPYLRYITPLRQLCERYFKELYKSAYLSILHDCKFFVCLNFAVIVHVVGEQGRSFFIPYTAKIALVYCPFDQLVSRIKRRNEHALARNRPLEMRYFSIVFEQFSKLFKAQQFLESPLSHVEEISKEHMCKQIKHCYDHLPFFSPRLSIDIHSYLENLFINLGSRNSHTFFLLPRYPSSLLLFRSIKVNFHRLIDSINTIFLN